MTELVAFISGANKAGKVFAKVNYEDKELQVEIPPAVAERAPSEMQIDNRIVVDAMPIRGGGGITGFLATKILSVEPAAEYKGPARVKWFTIDKMYGCVTIEDASGKREAFIPTKVVSEMGWLPEQGAQLEVEAFETAKGWVVDSFILVEDKRDAA